MIRTTRARWITPPVLQLLVCAFHMVVAVQAQVRGVYPLGMSATNSGVTPDAGFTYSNQLLIYSRNIQKCTGYVVATGNNSIVMDMNTLAWVSERKILGGASFSMSTFPFANNSLTSDIAGHISGGGGFAGICNRSIQSRQDVDSSRGGKVAIGFASVGCCFI
jgi:hypothetical protein